MTNIHYAHELNSLLPDLIYIKGYILFHRRKPVLTGFCKERKDSNVTYSKLRT